MDTMLDINGIEIKPGQTVRTQQPSGGILPPGGPKIGIVEKTEDAFDRETFQIRFRKEGQNFDSFILLKGKINEIIF